jgi:AbrB family looped-hinge helix DNA binding protein
MNTCKVDNQGRIVVPSSWRQKQGIKPGEALRVVEEEDGGLRVETLKQSVRRAQEIIRRTTKPSKELASDQLIRERREEVAAFQLRFGKSQRNG